MVGSAEEGVDAVAGKNIVESDCSSRTIYQPVFAAPYTLLDTRSYISEGLLADDRDRGIGAGRSEENGEVLHTQDKGDDRRKAS